MSLDRINSSKITKPTLAILAGLALSSCANFRAEMDRTLQDPLGAVAQPIGVAAEAVTDFTYDQLGIKRESYEPNLRAGVSYEVTWPLCPGDPNLFRSAERARQNDLDQREQGAYFGHIWQSLSKALPGAEKFETQFQNYWGYELYFKYEKATHAYMMKQKGKKVLKTSVALASSLVGTDLYIATDLAVHFADQMRGIDQRANLAQQLNMPQSVERGSSEAALEAIKRVAIEKWEGIKSFFITDKTAEEAKGIVITAIAFTPMSNYRNQVNNICYQSSTAEVRW